jgi:hypothetical protein
MQFADRLPLQVKCWNCSKTVKLGSPASADLDSASDARPDSAAAVGVKPPSKKKLDSPSANSADSLSKHPVDSASNHTVHSAGNHRADSPANQKVDSLSNQRVISASSRKVDPPSNQKTDLASVAALDSPSATKVDSRAAEGRVSRSAPREDSRSAKRPESPSEEMGPPTIAVSSAKPHERSKDARLAGARDSRTSSLTLPQDKTIKISVVTGPSQGKEYDLSRPLVTIGRLGGGADIEIDDAEVSRVHCAVEVRRDTILLHDMRSTNGTYLGDSRVFSARLEDRSTFRVGSTILQVSFLTSTIGRRTQ